MSGEIKNECRICKRPFNDTSTSKEHRKNIFKRDSDNISLQTRFAKFGLNLQMINDKSHSLCKKCITKLTTLEKADTILEELGLKSNQRPQEVPEEVLNSFLSHKSTSSKKE